MSLHSDALSQHPLFRALVLMGGGLALSCGGVAQNEGRVSENAGAPPGGATSTPSPGESNAGDGSASGGLASAGNAGASIVLGQAGGATSGVGGSAGIPTSGDCPLSQWDCSQHGASCTADLSVGLGGLGCVCDLSRPVTANDCGVNESLFCLQGYGLTDPQPETWDYSNHVQCACAVTPLANDVGGATYQCLELFLGETHQSMTAYLPATTTCDGTVCTATSADVLRQEGIMCGCADIGLK